MHLTAMMSNDLCAHNSVHTHSACIIRRACTYHLFLHCFYGYDVMLVAPPQNAAFGCSNTLKMYLTHSNVMAQLVSKRYSS